MSSAGRHSGESDPVITRGAPPDLVARAPRQISDSIDDEPLRTGRDVEVKVVAMRAVVIRREDHVEDALVGGVAKYRAELERLVCLLARAGIRSARRRADPAEPVVVDV